jgi:FixJ family two-component response regulator
MADSVSTYVAVIDDDPSVGRSLGRLLSASGIYSVAYTSAEAFLADTKRPKFDCLLLDIQLGGMSGLELARRLAASGPATPVIYITAHDEPERRAEALATGCAGYFRKTDSGSELLEAIRRAIALGGAGSG